MSDHPSGTSTAGDLASGPAEPAAPVPPPAGLDVLFVGNSYTFSHDLPALLSQLASSVDPSLLVRAVGITEPGWTLQQHWEAGRAIRAIHRGGWEVVVLQGHSLSSLEATERLTEYVRRFDAVIDDSGAQSALFMTWARRDQPEMIETITSVYSGLARQTGAWLVPVGLAWDCARTRLPEIHLHHVDGSHPSPAGSYLAASVFYSVLSGGRPSVGADHAGFGELDRAEIQALQVLGDRIGSGGSCGPFPPAPAEAKPKAP